MGKGICKKQTVIAIIVDDEGRFWVGSNWVENEQLECPRKDMATGIGYQLCKDVCKQSNHAEIDALNQAGKDARGATLYLIGHTYCCDDCKFAMEVAGIVKTVIVKSQP